MRYAISIAAGIATALGLFLLMHALIAGQPDINKDDLGALNLDYVRVKEDLIDVKKDRRKPPEPEKPKEPPPPPKLTVQNNDKPPPDIPDIKTPNVDIAVAGDGVYLGGFDAGNPGQDGDVIPIVRIEPQYPRDAAMNGIEGWVDVAILIAADGSVKNVDVVDSDPRRVFDKAARRAVYKWKFKPRVVDGQAVERTANTRLNFSLGQQ